MNRALKLNTGGAIWEQGPTFVVVEFMCALRAHRYYHACKSAGYKVEYVNAHRVRVDK